MEEMKKLLIMIWDILPYMVMLGFLLATLIEFIIDNKQPSNMTLLIVILLMIIIKCKKP